MYVLTELHYGEVTVIGAYTNLKELHKAIPTEAPNGYTFKEDRITYPELVKVFRDRKGYSRMTKRLRMAYCEQNDCDREYQVTYILPNITH